MPRLPVPGQDNGQWGNLINQFLEVEHINTPNDPNNGKLKRWAEIDAKYTKPAGGIPESDLHTDVQTKLGNVGSNVPQDSSITDAKVATNAAIAQTKIASTMGNSSLAADIAAKASSTDYRLSDPRLRVLVGSNQSSRITLNFLAGSGVAISATDDSANDRINIQISATNPTTSTPPPWTNVMDHGATGDGSTNDTAAFQAAIASIKQQPDVGGILYVPRGTYVLNQQLNIDGLQVVGDGPGISTLKWPSDIGSSSTVVHGLNMYPGAYGTAVKNITLLGPSGPRQLGVRQVWMHAIHPCGACLIRDVEISGFNTGIYLTQDHERLEDIKITNCYYGAYFAPSNTQGSQVFYNCDFTGQAYASVGISNDGIQGGIIYMNVRFGKSPYAFFKEAPGIDGKNVIMLGMVLAQCSFDSCGNGIMYGTTNPGVGGVVMTSCSSSNNFDSGHRAPGQPIDALVVAGSWGYGRILGANPFNTLGTQAAMKLVSFGGNYVDDCGEIIDASAAAGKEYIDATQTGQAELHYYGARCRTMIANTPVQRWSLIEGLPDSWCREYTNKAPIGVAVLAHPNKQGTVIVAHTGEIQVRVAAANNVTAMKYLKPDPANVGCAMEATGPQDGAIFAYSLEDKVGSTVKCRLMKCG